MTNSQWLRHIQQSGRPCYFISPHFDDAVFSAGALAAQLAPTNEVQVVTVFTTAEAGAPTLSARAYLRQCGYQDVQALYHDRQQEDAEALRGLASRVHTLGFSEALWRGATGRTAHLLAKIMPEFGKLYPTYRWHVATGRIARGDKPHLEAIKARLRELVPADALVFCPYGIGGHVDHVLTRQACEEVFPAPILWADYPYSLQTATNVPDTLYESHSIDPSDDKPRLMAKYRTQFTAMFPHGVQMVPERFFIRK